MLKVKMMKTGILVSTLVLCPLFSSFAMAVECGSGIVSTIPGQYKPLPPVDFVEEWDNGLTGNHPWIHHTYISDPDAGSVKNVIVDIGDGILSKDSVRDVGSGDNTLNESVFNFYDTPPFLPGLPVTPETYVEFRIDDLSINAFPPDPDGSTSSWQYFSLSFNSGPGTEIISIEFSDDGQWAPANLTIGTHIYYYVPLEQDATFNIHSVFQTAGIEIPEPLFLIQAIFNQTLWSPPVSATVEYHQHMEVDYIRVLDGRE